MSGHCQRLGPFFDGQLSPSEAERFRGHLVDCEECQRGLDELLQLDVLGARHLKLREARERAAGVIRPPFFQLRRPEGLPWKRWAGGGLALAASLALVVAYFPRGSVPDSVFHPGGDEGRLVVARSSYPRAAGYRKLAEGKLGSGQGKPLLSYEDLAKLKEPLAIASALLVHGSPSHVEEALQRLGDSESADFDSERAMAHLVRGDADRTDLEEALRHAERALGKDPRHGPALWNKALALQGLELTLLAASTFDRVAQLQEPGWATEARARAEALRNRAGRLRSRYLEAETAAEKLMGSGASLPAEAGSTSIDRRRFYIAVRMRTSPEEVKALLPLADRMDAATGGTHLRNYVQWVAGRNFTVRAPLIATYRRLRQASGEEAVRLARVLWDSGEDDLAVIAMDLSPEALDEDNLRRLVRRAGALRDPWFESLALLKRGQVREATDLRAALKDVEEAIRISSSSRLEDQLFQARIQRITVLLRRAELAEARKEAVVAWSAAVAGVDSWDTQVQILENLAQLARLRNDYPVAKAYLEEVVERTREDNSRKHEQYARVQLADLEMTNLHPALAREQLDAAIATGLPLGRTGLTGYAVLADVARSHPAAKDRQLMDELRATLPTRAGGQRALATQFVGRWAIEVDPDEGRKLLRDAIAQASSVDDTDGDAPRARASSYSALIMDAGRRGDFASVLEYFGEEAGAPFPERCAVALDVSLQRSVVVARGPDGQIKGQYDGARKSPVGAHLGGLVPEHIRAVLNGCQEVNVVARPPHFGKLGALPGTVPWTYLLLGRSRADMPPHDDPARPGTHLVVQSVAVSTRFQRLGLRVPQPWVVAPPPAGIVVLSGEEASPSGILSAMREATDIDIVTHSVINPISHEAFLVTAEAPEGDELTATQLRGNQLARRPIVTLSACRAAHTAPVSYSPRSLPAALLLAGARVVLAAHEEVPEREGPIFFAAVRSKIREGVSPAMALSDVRQTWRSQGKARGWVESVLLFQQ